MLRALSIKNVVLIESLSLEFDLGLNALTGETGAGKSIILDALGMATGRRADRHLVRAGADRAECTATFSIGANTRISRLLKDAEIENFGDELILRRLINVDGRSRAFVNDTPVSVKLLGELGADLLEVHGQHDGRGLLDPLQHIHMLDQFGHYSDLLSACASDFQALSQAKATYERLQTRLETLAAERDYLEHAVAELDRLDPKTGEELELSDRRRFLQGAESALEELSFTEAVLSDAGDLEEKLSRALAGIDRVKSKLGSAATNVSASLDGASEAVERAMLEMQEARNAVSLAATCFDIEPGALDATEKRLFALRAAARKYDVDVETLSDKRNAMATELETLAHVDTDIEQAKRQLKTCQAAYEASARALSKARHQAAQTLSERVEAELPPLKMERAKFIVDVSEAQASRIGTDKVRFVVSTNPGSPAGPLEKMASGGELARFALAIKVALAERTDSVMVFDEVDQGVGGAVADAVGRRLARLSDRAQVFVVTHSPQVAAVAHHQYLIQKSSTGLTTTTYVTRIGAEDREEEIARMLAGEMITPEARAAARQLMQAS